MTIQLLNDYGIGDTNFDSMMLTLDKAYTGKHSLTLSEWATTVVPAIAAGSWIEVGGGLYKVSVEEAISTTDPDTAATVADGTVYIYMIPVVGTASGATTDNAGYAIGDTVITLASAGTGTILAGDRVLFAGDTISYAVATGDSDVSNGGTIVLESPGLLNAIPASATAITISAGALSAAFTATVPTWNDSKQGYYGTAGTANYRFAPYVMTKATAAYSNKDRFSDYPPREDIQWFTETFEIGDWDMTSSTTVTVNHSLGALYKNIRKVNVIIRSDNDNSYTPSPAADVNGEVNVGPGRIISTDIVLARKTGGSFDNALYDSTSFNRGWVTLEYFI